MTLGGSTPMLAGQSVAVRRDHARAAVAARGLASAAVEIVVRQAMGRVPPSMVDRARVLLRRFFSDGPWRIDDDTALAAIVGPGSGNTAVALDDELTIIVAYRASSLRVDVEFAVGDVDDAPAPAAPNKIELLGSAPLDTDAAIASFEHSIVPEAGPNARIVRFLTGPATGGSGGWVRDPAATRDDRVARVLRTFVDAAGVLLGNGFVAVELTDEHRWDELLMPLTACITEAFAAPREPSAPERQLERARLEFAEMNPDSARGIAKIREALRSPDAAVRQVAVELIGHDDPYRAERAWKTALDDTSRAVRRAAVVAMARADREALRPLLERALREHDALARYHAVVGLGRIGVERSRPALQRCLTDIDARVRLVTRSIL